MGKSGLIGRKIAATFSSTGTPSVFLHPAEAVHGDLGMLMRDDVVLAVSYGGETEEIVALLETIKRLGLRMITLTGHPESTIAAASDVVLDVSVKEEACSLNLAPTASTTAAMAMGDALAVSLLDRRGFSPGDFAALHPGGRLGKKLLRVENLMHAGENMPRVPVDGENAGRDLRNEQKGLGHDHGCRWRRPPRRNPDRRRSAPPDAAARSRHDRTGCRRLHEQELRKHLRPANWPAAPCASWKSEKSLRWWWPMPSGSRSAWCTCTICGRWNCSSSLVFSALCVSVVRAVSAYSVKPLPQRTQRARE